MNRHSDRGAEQELLSVNACGGCDKGHRDWQGRFSRSMLEGLMLRWISILGGLPIMMGHHTRSAALFYYFRLEDQIPENHLLRLIDKQVSFDHPRLICVNN